MEIWFRDAWRLNEEVLLAALNEDLFLLEFDSLEKAKWVLESGRRSFKGGALQLEWWSPESGCIRRKDLVQEAWIRVVGNHFLKLGNIRMTKATVNKESSIHGSVSSGR